MDEKCSKIHKSWNLAAKKLSKRKNIKKDKEKFLVETILKKKKKKKISVDNND
jgi:hypothetical protein